MSLTANYASTPATAAVIITSANTARVGGEPVGTLLSAGANGSRVDEINIAAMGAVTAGAIRLFLHNGSTFYLWKEIPVPATTPVVGSVAPWSYILSGLGLILKTGWSIRVSTHNAEPFSVSVVTGGDL